MPRINSSERPSIVDMNSSGKATPRLQILGHLHKSPNPKNKLLLDKKKNNKFNPRVKMMYVLYS